MTDFPLTMPFDKWEENKEEYYSRFKYKHIKYDVIHKNYPYFKFELDEFVKHGFMQHKEDYIVIITEDLNKVIDEISRYE